MKGNGNFEGLTKDTMAHYPPRLLLLGLIAQRHPVTVKTIAEKIINSKMTKKQLDNEIMKIGKDMNTLAELRVLLLYARKKK